MEEEVIVMFHGYPVSNYGYIYGKRGDILKMRLNPNGYLVTDLYYDHSTHTVPIHQIVANCHCEKPRGCNVVHHKNGIKTDNRACNLQWVSYSVNNLEHSKEVNNGHRVYCNSKEYFSIGEASRCEKVSESHIRYWLLQNRRDKKGRLWTDGQVQDSR